MASSDSTDVQLEGVPAVASSTAGVGASAVVELDRVSNEPAEPARVSEAVPPSKSVVWVVNLELHAAYVPLKSRRLRLAPKAAAWVAVEELTEGARRVEAEGRIHIRTL